MSDKMIQVELTEDEARDVLSFMVADSTKEKISAALLPEHPDGTIAWLTLSTGHRVIAVRKNGMWTDGHLAVYVDVIDVEPLRVLADDDYAYVIPDGPKMLRETLCVAQSRIGNSWLDVGRRPEHVARIQRLIDECDRHRPLGIGGKHGDLHTPTCGCKR